MTWNYLDWITCIHSHTLRIFCNMTSWVRRVIMLLKGQHWLFVQWPPVYSAGCIGLVHLLIYFRTEYHVMYVHTDGVKFLLLLTWWRDSQQSADTRPQGRCCCCHCSAVAVVEDVVAAVGCGEGAELDDVAVLRELLQHLDPLKNWWNVIFSPDIYDIITITCH